MKRSLALLMALILIFAFCGCEKKPPKQIVVVSEVVIPRPDDTDSDDASSESETVYSYESKEIATDIGKNYYILAPEVAHPGVVGMDATYTMTAKDRRFYELASDRIILSSSNKKVKIDGTTVKIPYEVRKSEKVTITMKDKENPNRTGSYTFDFVKFTAEPTFLEDFNSLDLSIWSDDFFDFKKDTTKPIETASVENGELVLRTEKADLENGGKKLGYHLTTSGCFNQSYGCFSARIKLPTSGLTNTAFWLFNESGGRYLKNPQMPSQSGGEIDILEYFPMWGNSRISHALHYNGQGTYLTSAGLEAPVADKVLSEYHVYSVVWTETDIFYYIDDELSYHYTGDGVGKGSDPMFLIVQHNSYPHGEYNAWAKYTSNINDFPNESRWDWVRAYGIEGMSEYVYAKGLDHKNN